MTRHRPSACLIALAALAVAAPLLVAGCGKKGPPLAPLVVVPARIDDLTLRRLGDDVHLQFTLPVRNADGTEPATLSAVEVYAITGPPVDQFGRSLDGRDFARYGTLVARIEVAPPPPRGETAGETAETRPPDPRPKQGERLMVVDRWSPAALVPFVHPRTRAAVVVEPDEPTGPVARPAVSPVPEILTRTYVAAGRNRRGDLGPLSARLSMPVVDRPATPGAPDVTYTETSVRVEWTRPPGARQPIQAAPGPGDLRILRVPFVQWTPHTFNVYERLTEVGTSAEVGAPRNPTPIPGTAFEIPGPGFGIARCYEVRMVEALGPMTLESHASPPTCVTPIDTFPPEPPRGLSVVGSEGAINLIWEPNTEPDLAGYLVLRGEYPGDVLMPLTSAPIRETTYRDATVSPGVRYIYAVVAVDTATPANRSAESARVEETGR